MHLAATPAPLGPHPLLVFLTATTVLLLLARLLGRIAERCALPAVVGELTTGILLGPSLLGHAAPGVAAWLLPDRPEQTHLLDAVGQLGVVLLVGVTGTHLDVAMLRRRGLTAALVSGCGLVLPLGLGVATGFLLPSSVASGQSPRWVFALFIGVAMCVSAIPVIAKTLSDMRLLHRNIGQLTLAAGIVDDAVGWLLLSIVSAAATIGVGLAQVGRSVGYVLGFVVLAMLVARPLVNVAMRHAARAPEPGTSAATAVLIVFAGAVCTQGLGMEPIFGAFVAGLLIAMSGAPQVRLAPLRTVVLSVLAPLFLATAGLRTDLTELRRPAVAVTAVVVLVVAVAGKFAGAYAGARLGRLSRWEGLALGAGLNARGVVEVVVALTGLRLGVLSTATYTVVVLVAVVTSVMAPPLLRLAMARIGYTEEERLRRIDHDTWHGRLPAGGSPEAVVDPVRRQGV